MKPKKTTKTKAPKEIIESYKHLLEYYLNNKVRIKELSTTNTFITPNQKFTVELKIKKVKK